MWWCPYHFSIRLLHGLLYQAVPCGAPSQCMDTVPSVSEGTASVATVWFCLDCSCLESQIFSLQTSTASRNWSSSYCLQFFNYSDIIPLFAFQVSVPMTEGLDPILMLTDDATVAAWHNQGLPNDRMSTENASILTTSERWPLIIDPQQQGIKWIRNRLGPELRVVQLGQKGWEGALIAVKAPLIMLVCIVCSFC